MKTIRPEFDENEYARLGTIVFDFADSAVYGEALPISLTIGTSGKTVTNFAISNDETSYYPVNTGTVLGAEVNTTYTVSYVDGVDDETIDVPDAQTKYYNESLTLSNTVPTREGYSFTGWSESDSKTYQAGNTYATNAELTLTAQWQKNTVTITWMNGDTQLKRDTVDYGATPSYSGDTPTKDAIAQYTYTFVGWATTNGGTKLDTLPAASEDETYYDHVYVPTITAPTCTEGGFTTYTCTICNRSHITDETVALGHDLSDWIITVDATCTEDGSKTRVCKREGCDYSETEVIEATGHIHETVVTDPTCDKGGYTTHTCHCGDSYVTDEVPALGHSVVYAVDTAPTLEAKGTLAGTCERCGENLKIVLPKLSKEDYVLEVLVEPTKEAEGLGKYTWNVTDFGTFSFEAAISNVVLGDVNGDGDIGILDLMRLANHFAKGLEINKANADVNCDGNITILDLMRLANFFAGKAQLG